MEWSLPGKQISAQRESRLMVQTPIYLDNHATTRCDPRVRDVMLPYFCEEFGNAASITHVFGERAKDAVEKARETIAAAVDADPREVIFTSGATESNNLAILGVGRCLPPGSHLVASSIEHPSVLEPLQKLSEEGHTVTLVRPVQNGDPQAGRVLAESVEEALKPNTRLVSIMAANNEIGSLQPIREIAALCRERGIIFHVDAVQALGKVPLRDELRDADLISLSAHKVYGPKGVGALIVRRRQAGFKIQPLIYGGGHERGLRSGTLNVPGIVGFAHAVALALADLENEMVRLQQLRNLLFNLLKEQLGERVQLNGPDLSRPDWRLPGNLNVRFPGIEGETLLLHVPELALSSGSACSSADPRPSHVLLALGLSETEARASIRVGIGRFNTEEEIRYAADVLCSAVRQLVDLQSALEGWSRGPGER